MWSVREVIWEQTACPLCEADDARPLLRAPDRLFRCPGEFQLVRCQRCGHVYVNPRPVPEWMQRYYPADYGPHHPPVPPAATPATTVTPADGRSPWYLSPLARHVPGLRRLYYWLKESYAEVIPTLPQGPGRALELGCADGQFLSHLRGLGWEVQGVEPAAEPARRAQANGLPVHMGTLEPGLFPAQHFDATFASMVVEHLPDPCRTLQELHRILKPGGWLVMTIPNFACWERRFFGTYWYVLCLPLHLQHFTPRTVRAMLQRAGYCDVRVLHQRNLFNVVGSLGIWLREKFPRSPWGPRLVQFTDNPSMWGQLALAPLAKLLAWLHQGGRLTVVARSRPDGVPESEPPGKSPFSGVGVV